MAKIRKKSSENNYRNRNNRWRKFPIINLKFENAPSLSFSLCVTVNYMESNKTRMKNEMGKKNHISLRASPNNRERIIWNIWKVLPPPGKSHLSPLNLKFYLSTAARSPSHGLSHEKGRRKWHLHWHIICLTRKICNSDGSV